MVGGPHSLENGWAGDGQPHNISCGETVLCAQLSRPYTGASTCLSVSCVRGLSSGCSTGDSTV